MKMILFSVVLSIASSIGMPSCTSNPPHKEPARTWFKAKGESKRQPLVTFLIMGQTVDQTGNQIGKFIQVELEKRKIPSKYYLLDRNDDGVGIAFFLKGEIYQVTKLPQVSKYFVGIATEFAREWPDYVYDGVAFSPIDDSN